jgi:hypothetical protein
MPTLRARAARRRTWGAPRPAESRDPRVIRMRAHGKEDPASPAPRTEALRTAGSLSRRVMREAPGVALGPREAGQVSRTPLWCTPSAKAPRVRVVSSSSSVPLASARRPASRRTAAAPNRSRARRISNVCPTRTVTSGPSRVRAASGWGCPSVSRTTTATADFRVCRAMMASAACRTPSTVPRHGDGQC